MLAETVLITKEKFREKTNFLGGFRMETGCADQVFNLRMSAWLLSLLIDGILRYINAGIGNVVVEMCKDDPKWRVNTNLSAGYTVLTDAKTKCN